MKYSQEQISNILNDYGFKLIEYINVKNIIAKDNNNYMYKITLSNLLQNKKPHWLMRNPYALDNFILYMSKTHPDYLLLDNEYNGVKHKMKFICKRHSENGIQYNTIDNIVNNNHVCKYCGYENLGKIKRISFDVAKELCDERNVELEFLDAKDNETQINYSCKKHMNHGIQSMSLTHFKSSLSPCHYCNKSNGEVKIDKYLNDNNIKYISEKMFEDCVMKRKLRFDFYLPDYNTIIEYDGRQHFEPVSFWNHEFAKINFEKTKIRDEIKNKYCLDNNINLIRIPYTKYKSIENILDIELNKIINE